MQRIEQDENARRKLQASALAAEKGEIDTLDVQDVVVEGKRDTKIPWADRLRGKKTAQTDDISEEAGSGSPERQAPSSVRASRDDYQPPQFTPPAEEKANPFEAPKTQPKGRGGHP